MPPRRDVMEIHRYTSVQVHQIRSDLPIIIQLTRVTPPEEFKSWVDSLPFLKRPEEELLKFEENPA